MDSTSATLCVIGVILVYFIWMLSKKRYNFMKDPPTPKGILPKGILPDPGPFLREQFCRDHFGETIFAGTILVRNILVAPFLNGTCV